MTGPYPPLADTVFAPEREVRYIYWPVNFRNGDLNVIGNAPLPLSGVQFSQSMRGVGEFRASLQLSDPEVIAMNPWEKVIPRKTGIVTVREEYNPVTGLRSVSIPHYATVYAAPSDPHTGRMTITGQTIEGAWARNLITKQIIWDNVDQAFMAADLLDPAVFSQVPLSAAPWPGWITIDPPTVGTGVVRDFTYNQGQETNLLEAHQNRSKVDNGYEWTTAIRVLSGTSPVDASSFRPQFVLGYPKLGRRRTDTLPIPRLRYSTDGTGNVVTYSKEYDGSEVPNIVWARGNGYDEQQVSAMVMNNEASIGFLRSEARFSDPDVSLVSTLTQYAYTYMWDKLGSEQFISKLTLRGDLPPYFNSYVIGDDVILETNDPTWPIELRPNGFVELGARIFGWVITPPQGSQAEHVDLVISAGSL